MEPNLIVVRDAHPGDARTIFGFNQLLALETENRNLPDDVLMMGIITALEQKNRLRYWVAEARDKVALPIGQIAVSYEWSDWRNGWIWWLQSVYVDQRARKTGVFRALLNHVQFVAKSSADVIGLRLYVEHENLPARMTYTKLGFQKAGYDVMELMWADKTIKSGSRATDPTG